MNTIGYVTGAAIGKHSRARQECRCALRGYAGTGIRQRVLPRRRAFSLEEREGGGSEGTPARKSESGKEGEGGESIAEDEENDASGLVLPDLRSLFAGAGKEGCEQCGGSGEAPCPVCEAKGFVSVTMMDTVSSSQCRMCKGKRAIPCPSCRQEVYSSVLWWDLIPPKEEDSDEDWAEGPDGEPRLRWSSNPADPSE